MKMGIAMAVLLAWPMLAHATSDLRQFAYQQQPGSQLPLDTRFHDQTGREVRLGDIVRGRPTILALGYFHCPNLCGLVRTDLIDAMMRSGLAARHDYTLLVLSIDPAETPSDAAHAADEDAARAGAGTLPPQWHYLTGPADAVAQVERQVGFHTRFDPALRQFLHPSGLVFLTPRGTVSSYLLDIGYQPGDVSLAVARAREGSIAKAALPVLLLCFHYDPSTGRYTLAITRLLDIACVLTALTVGGTIALVLRRERRT